MDCEELEELFRDWHDKNHLALASKPNEERVQLIAACVMALEALKSGTERELAVKMLRDAIERAFGVCDGR